jgi:uncharacterized protein YyaL (SSP411 family)
LDDKVLASWNGLALTAFAKAAFILNDQRALQTAVKNAEFLEREMISDGRLLRSWKDGAAKLNGYLEDYAFVVEGLLTLFQVNGDFNCLKLAQRLTETQLELFWDSEKGSFFYTSSDHEKLIVRPKEYFDNAIPSGNSTSALNLLTLARITGKDEYQSRADSLLRSIGTSLARFPLGLGNWLVAANFSLGPVVEVVVTGQEDDHLSLLEPIREKFLPNKVMVLAENRKSPEKTLPLLEGRQLGEGGATVYVCQDFTCREPTSDPDRLREILEEF